MVQPGSSLGIESGPIVNHSQHLSSLQNGGLLRSPQKCPPMSITTYSPLCSRAGAARFEVVCLGWELLVSFAKPQVGVEKASGLICHWSATSRLGAGNRKSFLD